MFLFLSFLQQDSLLFGDSSQSPIRSFRPLHVSMLTTHSPYKTSWITKNVELVSTLSRCYTYIVQQRLKHSCLLLFTFYHASIKTGGSPRLSSLGHFLYYRRVGTVTRHLQLNYTPVWYIVNHSCYSQFIIPKGSHKIQKLYSIVVE